MDLNDRIFMSWLLLIFMLIGQAGDSSTFGRAVGFIALSAIGIIFFEKEEM